MVLFAREFVCGSGYLGLWPRGPFLKLQVFYWGAVCFPDEKCLVDVSFPLFGVSESWGVVLRSVHEELLLGVPSKCKHNPRQRPADTARKSLATKFRVLEPKRPWYDFQSDVYAKSTVQIIIDASPNNAFTSFYILFLLVLTRLMGVGPTSP